MLGYLSVIYAKVQEKSSFSSVINFGLKVLGYLSVIDTMVLALSLIVIGAQVLGYQPIIDVKVRVKSSSFRCY